MIVHELKIHPKFLKDIQLKKKCFEVRKNDRNYQIGDILHLREYLDGEYTGISIARKVIYIFDDADYVKEGFVILGLNK